MEKWDNTPWICKKSVDGKHEWKEVTGRDPVTLMEDWGVIPGTYCIHCDRRQEDCFVSDHSYLPPDRK